MNDGMLSVAWATERPAASVSTQAKSLLSRTTVENEVRTSAAAASSTIEISRVHRTSSVIALSVAMCLLVRGDLRGDDDVGPLLALSVDVPPRVLERAADRDHAELLDLGVDRRARDRAHQRGAELVDHGLGRGARGRDGEPGGGLVVDA